MLLLSAVYDTAMFSSNKAKYQFKIGTIVCCVDIVTRQKQWCEKRYLGDANSFGVTVKFPAGLFCVGSGPEDRLPAFLPLAEG